MFELYATHLATIVICIKINFTSYFLFLVWWEGWISDKRVTGSFNYNFRAWGRKEKAVIRGCSGIQTSYYIIR